MRSIVMTSLFFFLALCAGCAQRPDDRAVLTQEPSLNALALRSETPADLAGRSYVVLENAVPDGCDNARNVCYGAQYIKFLPGNQVHFWFLQAYTGEKGKERWDRVVGWMEAGAPVGDGFATKDTGVHTYRQRVDGSIYFDPEPFRHIRLSFHGDAVIGEMKVDQWAGGTWHTPMFGAREGRALVSLQAKR